ncbi:alpha/beta hydrolase [Aquabacterium sp. A7-Y]|uniref:alpha/beta hydrolase n=1 Tax=Aquabacterium sp. A7-Y TaxID=1349605 RepID=UPI00223CD54B|nr:alpha/beta hydrolase [Aquabacterium sp. A7-Y]MCW7537917.1 alpha/beta hydrolase [Aquabacterium sp. A7-Y]
MRHLPPCTEPAERLAAAAARLSLRCTFKLWIGPPFPAGLQRAVVHGLSLLMPPGHGVEVCAERLAGPGGVVPAERILPAGRRPPRALLYLHGGAFCICNPRTHRAITTRLARLADAQVLVPRYRRAPEHPFPAQIEDGVAAYRQLLADGFAPGQIAIAGDSAGGTLALLVPLALRRLELPLPGALVLMSPLTDTRLQAPSLQERRRRDPMLRTAWAEQAGRWYAIDWEHPLANPMQSELDGLPPTLVQVCEDEILYDDSIAFARRSAEAGNEVELEIIPDRWHVFQMQAGLLPSAAQALQRQADFLRRHGFTSQLETRP